MKYDTRVWPPVKRPKRGEIVTEALEDMDTHSLEQLAYKEVLRVYYHSRGRRPGRKL
jgi:hypothetical protein